MGNESPNDVPIFGESKTSRKPWLWLLVLLVPVSLLGGNYVMDAITSTLDGKCVRLDTNATLCVHREP